MLDAKDLANEYGLSFSKGYTEFLDRFPDGVASFPLPEWPEAAVPAETTKHEGKPAAKNKGSKGSKGSTGSKGSKGSKAAPTPREPPTWCEHVAAIYGIAELDEMYQGAKADGDCHFWNRRLLPHAYVVARTAGGDPIVQVATGAHAGVVLLTNHETYYGFFEHIAAMIPSEAQREFYDETRKVWKKLGVALPRELDTDAIVGFLLHEDFDGAVVIASSFEEFYATLGRARGVGPAPATSSRSAAPALPTVTQVHAPPADDWGTELRAAGGDGTAVRFVGSRLGKSVMFTTTDGLQFAKSEPPHPDVNDLHATEGEIWLAGARTIVRSTDGGKTFGSPIELDLGGDYLWGIARDHSGRLWVLGKDGRLATSTDDGRTFTIIEPGQKGLGIGRLRASPLGVLIPSGRTIRIGKDGAVRTATTLRTEHEIDDVLYTADGSLLTCDRANHVHRSTDGGETWTRSRILAGDAEPNMLRCLAQARPGWIVVAGGAGFVAVSFDDGRTFRSIAYAPEVVSHDCAVAHGDGVLLGSSMELVHRVIV